MVWDALSVKREAWAWLRSGSRSVLIFRVKASVYFEVRVSRGQWFSLLGR
jgi:hypothetical protein